MSKKYFGDPFSQPALKKRENLEKMEPALLHYSKNTRYVGAEYWMFWQRFLDLYESNYTGNELQILHRLIENRQSLVAKEPIDCITFNADQVKSVEDDGSIILFSQQGFPQLFPHPVDRQIAAYAPFLKQPYSGDIRFSAKSTFSLNPANVFRLEGDDYFAGNEEKRFLEMAELAVQRPIYAPIGLTRESISIVAEHNKRLYLIALKIETLNQCWKI